MMFIIVRIPYSLCLQPYVMADLTELYINFMDKWLINEFHKRLLELMAKVVVVIITEFTAKSLICLSIESVFM